MKTRYLVILYVLGLLGLAKANAQQLIAPPGVTPSTIQALVMRGFLPLWYWQAEIHGAMDWNFSGPTYIYLCMADMSTPRKAVRYTDPSDLLSRFMPHGGWDQPYTGIPPSCAAYAKACWPKATPVCPLSG